MSGGRLVVQDRLGRDVKRYPLESGLATLGSDPACDIRVMLPAVSAHHATVVVHANQTVVRNVGDGDTLVNGERVSVAALRHGDVITLGDRALRWEYADAGAAAAASRRNPAVPAVGGSVVRRGGGGRARGRCARRGSAGAAGGAGAAGRDRALQLAIEMSHRASMPGSTGGKQVAIVQPQRRDTNDQNDKSNPRTQPQTHKRPRNSNLDASNNDEDKKRRSTKLSPKSVNLQNTTKATLWIESRKTSPRKSTKVHTPAQVPAVNVRRSASMVKKSTPLRMAVLRKAQSAQKMRVMKIEAPSRVDHTKQAAIMLMTGHTPKPKQPIPKTKTPSYLVKRPSPVRKTSRGKSKSIGRRSKENATPIGVTPKRVSTFEHSTTRRASNKSPGSQSVTILEITDSDAQNSTVRRSNVPRGSGQKSFQKSPSLPSPKKSALKDPKKNSRKTESIKFDLSNLESNTQVSNDVIMVTNTTNYSNDESMSDDDLTLHYSDSSSPSPRKPINSRSSKILEKSIGTLMSVSTSPALKSPDSPHVRKSLRGSIILQKSLDTVSKYSRGSIDASDHSKASVASAFKTHTLSPRSNQNNMESYSIVDLVSMDSNESARSASVYNSAASANNTTFGTPQNSAGRKTRSTIEPTLLGSSTPFVGKVTRSSNRSLSSTRSQSSPNITRKSTQSTILVSTRRSKSLSTPENTQKHISVNSTRISRGRSRLNDSDLLLIDGDESDASPKSSKRVSRATKSMKSNSTIQNTYNNSTYETDNSTIQDGISTPENRHSPEDVGTPMLSIKNLLNSSQNTLTSLSTRKGRTSKRKTIGVISEPKKGCPDYKSKSLNFSARKTILRLSKDSSNASDLTDEGAPRPDNEEMITPKSAVKLVQEAVKEKHSTAKKPQSKRSIIDDLNQSDIVKQLFNSPVKRKLSQSMTEFSRKQLFDDDNDVIRVKRLTRNTIALTGRSPHNSLLDQTEAITPDLFVSPINTANNSPNLAGIKRLFHKNTPDNDLRNVKGVKKLLRTPRTKRSVRNDLTNVFGVKAIFARSPRNRLTDVAVKNVFATSPKNDLRRVSGVKSLFQSQKNNKSPKNDLTDVRGVKGLFKESPVNDLRNVSGVKQTLRKNSPLNDLRDVRGVKKMFREEKKKNDCEVSGVEELFNESNRDTDSLFDQLVGKPHVKAVYSKTLTPKSTRKPKTRKTKSLNSSINIIVDNVEEWLEKELEKCLHKDTAIPNVTRELKKLATDTVEGTTPIRSSRVRDSTIIKVIQGENERKKSASQIYSAHKLPIKKRSIVEGSLDKTDNNRSTLPIKKRVVVHSTPVKGRVNLTMNASELGRVSPIVAVTKIRHVDHNTYVGSIQQPKETPSLKTKTTTKSKIHSEVLQIEPEPKPSPKKTRAKVKAKATNPVKARATRTKQSDTADSSDNTKKRRTSLVITKKSPAMSPKPVPRARRNKVNRSHEIKDAVKLSKVQQVISSKKITRRQKNNEVNDVEQTPKKSARTRVQKASVVVTKPSPQLKPRAAKRIIAIANKSGKAESNDDIGITQTLKKTRKTIVNASPKESQGAKRKTRAAVEIEVKAKGRRTAIQKQNTDESVKQKPQPKKGRKANIKSKVELGYDLETSIDKVPQTRGKQMSPKVTTKIQTLNTRGKAKLMEVNSTQTDKDEIKGKLTRTRGKLEPQGSVQSEPTSRTRRTKIENTVIPETKGRKRTTTVEEIVPSKVTRGRKRIIETTETETANGRQKKSIVRDSKVEISRSKQDGDTVNRTTRVVRSRKVVEEVIPAKKPEAMPVTGRKTVVASVESAPETKRRKRKPNLETSSVKESAKKQPVAKKPRKATEPVVVASPLHTRGRGARGKNSELEVPKKAAGRARRR